MLHFIWGTVEINIKIELLFVELTLFSAVSIFMAVFMTEW